MAIKVVNRHSFQGTNEYVGRGTPLGNPFILRREADRDLVCEQYTHWLRAEYRKHGSVYRALHRLAGLAKAGDLTLICSCAPKRCHADFIKTAIEAIVAKQLV